MKQIKPKPGDLLRCVKSCDIWLHIDNVFLSTGCAWLLRDKIVLLVEKRKTSCIILYNDQVYSKPLGRWPISEFFEKIM